MFELEVLVPDDSPPDCVVAFFLVLLRFDLAETVVHEFVHKTVEHGLAASLVDFVIAVLVIVVFFDLRVFGSCNPDDPHELRNIVTREVCHSAENYQHVVCTHELCNLVAFFLSASKCLTDSSDVGVVPSVVVNEHSAVCHACNLVAVVPPAHNFGVRRGVLLQPVVRFAVVVDDHAVAVLHSVRHDN